MCWFFSQRIGRRSTRMATGTLLVLVVLRPVPVGLGLGLFCLEAELLGHGEVAGDEGGVIDSDAVILPENHPGRPHLPEFAGGLLEAVDHVIDGPGL